MDYGLGNRLCRSVVELALEYPARAVNIVCPDCGSNLVLKEGKFGLFYGCKEYSETGCRGSCSCNQGTADPVGIPGDSKTRRARQELYLVLLRVQSNREVRPNPLKWLQSQLGTAAAGIGSFDSATCDKALSLCYRLLGETSRFERVDRDL